MILNFNDECPLYKQIYDQLRLQVFQGQLQAGQRLPSSRELAKQLGVSRTSVIQAFDQLNAEGYIYSHSGAGTFVADILPDSRFLRDRNRTAKEEKSNKDKVRAEKRFSSTSLQLSNTGQALVSLFPSGWQPWQPIAAPQYDFRVGGVAMHPRSLHQWQKLVHQCSSSVSNHLAHPQGDLNLRRAIAQYLLQHRACRCDESNIVITNGSQQAFDLLGRLLLNPKDNIAIEDPGYIGAQFLFRAQQANIIPIPVDQEGVDVNHLERLKSPAKMIYVTPSHQFPTGVIMSLSRRLALIDWAEKNDAYIIEDDYDGEFRYDGRPIESVQGLDPYQRTIYTGTFSKVLFPSLRVGYTVLPDALVQPFVALKWLSDFQSSSFHQEVLTRWIGDGFHQQHIRRMRKIYTARRKQLIESLSRYFSHDEITLCGENSGLHIMLWLNTISQKKQATLLEKCQAQSIALFPIDTSSIALRPKTKLMHTTKQSRTEKQCAVIIGFSQIEENAIDTAIKKFRDIIVAMQ